MVDAKAFVITMENEVVRYAALQSRKGRVVLDEPRMALSFAALIVRDLPFDSSSVLVTPTGYESYDPPLHLAILCFVNLGLHMPEAATDIMQMADGYGILVDENTDLTELIAVVVVVVAAAAAGVVVVLVVLVVVVVVVVVLVLSTPAQLCPNSGTHFCLTSSA